MDKQNKFVGSFNPFARPAHKKMIQTDNSILQVQMNDKVQREILESNDRLESMFESHLEDIQLLEVCTELDKFKECVLIQTSQQLKEMVESICKGRIVFVRIFQQAYRSFKGFCTWLSISTRDTSYLVDLLKLRSQFKSLGGRIFGDSSLLKIGLGLKQQIQGLQRDFNIFTRCTLDLKQLLNIWNYPCDLRYLAQEHLPAFEIPVVKEGNLYKRPCCQIQLKYMFMNSYLLQSILCLLRGKIAEDQTILEACHISNRYCLQPYSYNPSKLSQELQQEMKGNIKNERDSRILRKLLKWRIHTARIRDESPEYILPSRLLKMIIIRGVHSMGQFLSLHDQVAQKQICRDYDQTILDIVNSKSSKIDLVKAENEVNQCGSLNDFLKLVGWNDCSWKSENSQSMRLFKEIVSMDPIESSILDNELNETKNRVLTNDEVFELFGYVPYFMKNDQKGLSLQYSKFMQTYGNKQHQECQAEKVQVFQIPESIQEVYELANQKKKAMKKQKKKSSILEEKEEPFVINVPEFLKSIGWS